MSKTKKIIIISVVCVVIALTIILSVSLTVGSFENRFIKKMTNLQYDVEVCSDVHYYVENGNSYFTQMYASRSGGSGVSWVHVYQFKNKKDATKWYGYLTANKEDDERVVQDGKRVYCGTNQAILDLDI